MNHVRRNLGGANAPTVYAVGLGGMPLSLRGRPDEAQAIQTIHAALDAGVTLIDTADVYGLDHTDLGHNERLIAKALTSYPYDTSGVVVATKGGCTRPHGGWACDGRPEHLMAACEASLKALGVETIDLYQLHAPDVRVPWEDSVGTLVKLQQAGKIRMIGLSNVTVNHIMRARRVGEITTVQNRYNPFFWQDREPGVLEYCTQERMGYLAYSPLGGGRLHQKLNHHPTVGAVAKRRGATPHAVVLAWLLTKSPMLIPIPGARTPEHARDSASAAGLELTEEDIKELEAAEFSAA